MKLVLIICLFFAGFNHDSYAQLPDEEVKSLVREIDPNFELSKAELNILKQELKIQTMILESVKEMELEGVEFKNLTKVENSIQDLVENSMKMKSLDLGFRFQEKTSDIVRNYFYEGNMRVKLNKLKNFVVNDALIKKNAIVATARRYGLQLGIYYLVAAQVDYTIPIILMASGNVPLGTALFSTPFSSTTTSLFTGIKQLIKQKHLINQLGFSRFKERLQILKQVKTYFNRNLLKSDHLALLTVEGRPYSFTVEDTKLVQRLINKLGYNENSLNWENLAKFLRDEDLLITRLDEIEASGGPRLTKLMKILNEIESSGDTELINKLQLRFSKKIKTLNSTIHKTSHIRWFIQLSNSPSFDHFFILMKKMPEDLPARVFGKLWRDFALGNLTKAITEDGTVASYKAFRELHNLYDNTLKSQFVVNTDQTMSGNIKKTFIDYLYSATTSVNSCGQIYKMKKGATAPIM